MTVPSRYLPSLRQLGLVGGARLVPPPCAKPAEQVGAGTACLSPSRDIQPCMSPPSQGAGPCCPRGSLPAPRARHEAPSGQRGQRWVVGRWLPPWVSELGAGSFTWCESGQDPDSSTDSPLGNGCRFPSISVPWPRAPTVLLHMSAALSPQGSRLLGDGAGDSHWEVGTATLPRLEGGTAARSERYSSTGRAEREKIAIKATMEHLSWRAAGPARAPAWSSTGASYVWSCFGCCYPEPGHQHWLWAFLLQGDVTMASPPSLGQLVPSPWCPNLSP